MQETFAIDDQEYCHYEAQGPAFAHIAEQGTAGRNEIFHQRVMNDSEDIPTHTEQQGIEQLDAFLSHVADVAEGTENSLLRDEVQAFRQNLVFIDLNSVRPHSPLAMPVSPAAPIARVS